MALCTTPKTASSLRPAAKRRRMVVCAAKISQQADVYVVGAGAAGLASAYFAAVSGAKVQVLEKMEEAGKKILISGGTRCNVLPGDVDLQRDFVTESSQSALRAVFSSWSLDDCEYWLSDPHQVGVRLALEADTNKLFPASNSAEEVRDRLVAACRTAGVRFAFGEGLAGMQRRGDGAWHLALSSGAAVEGARRVVLATGGLSFPKLGTTGDGYRLLAQHGHELAEPYAALTPLTGRHPGGQQLAGISLYDARLAAVADGGGGGGGKKKAAARQAQRTSMLFTHRGYSGPAVLDLSHLAVRAAERGQAPPQLRVQWTGAGAAEWEERLQEGGAQLVPSLLRREGIPQRLAEALCGEAGVPLDRKLSELRRGERAALVDALTRYVLPVEGSEGYAKAEVTGGGVPLNQLSASTMESRLLPGVYVCGELVDVFGRIGGYNFWWAWASGRLAGLSAAEAAAGEAGQR